MVQLSIQAINNRNLFSNHYLEDLIRNNDEWRSNDHKSVFNEIKKIYDDEKPFLEDLNESQLEEKFFRRIFKIMLPDFAVQAGTESQDFPDYAFFEDTNALNVAHLNKGSSSFYQNAFAVGEVKRWDTNLDRLGKGKYDNTNPSFQIWRYLHETEPEWGVLSNGRLWRLYHQDKLMDSYYEVDLVTILEKGDIDAFKYFYYFFRREAFFSSQKGAIFLENVLRGSEDYAIKIGEDLKENVYRAMKILAEGFFRHPANGLDRNDEKARSEVQNTTMRLLYRFLFLLYAEGKGLLSGSAYIESPYSFHSIKNKIKEEKDSRNAILEEGSRYWTELQDLFGLIDAGNETLGIPAYNGGLFDGERNPNLLKWRIGDRYLADAIDRLSRSKMGNGGRRLGFVDYSSLDIRHLGSIYEGLLEYRLRVAETDMVATGGKKREWVSLEDFNSSRKRKKNFSDFDLFDRVKKDELYLSTDKGERKATGSYYTPDYIVNYIVKNTIDPVVDERWQKAKERSESLIDATLSVKVLDPAMGSGHFLVGALEHLSARLMEAVTIEEKSGRIPDDARDQYTPEWAKREVASHCIYGVDLNYLAVELAKVSLWLKTIAMDKPLSFLDHRLKCGNSLIGARLADLKEYPSSERRGKKKKAEEQSTLPSFVSRLFIDHLIGKIGELERISDDRLSDIKRKEQVFKEFRQLPEYRKAKAMADVHTAVYFGNEVGATANKKPEDVYHDIVWAIKGDEAEWKRKTNRAWFREAQRIAADKSFFHWELEFPEVFFEDGGVKENPGWDAVVGNPPYIPFQERDEEDSSYYGYIYDSAYRTYDLYVLFIEKSLKILRQEGKFGYINPNKFIHSQYGKAIKEFVMSTSHVDGILDFQDAPVFQEVTNYPCILLLTKTHTNKDRRIPYISIRSSTDIATTKQIKCLTPSDESFQFLQAWGEASSHFVPLTINNKITIPLKVLCKNIYEGVRPGYEKAYLLTYEDIIAESIEWDIIRPAVKSGRIDPYEVVWFEQGTDSLYIIFPYKWDGSNFVLVDLDEFPNAKRYLEQYKMLLYDNGGKGFPPLRYRYYHCPMEMSQRNRIITPDISNRCEFYLDSAGKFIFPNTIYGLSLAEGMDASPYFILSILNSGLIERIIKAMTPMVRGGFHRFKSEYLEKLPVRRINFTTPPEERTALVESLKSGYNANEFDKIIQLVEECLPKDAEGNFVTDAEKSDVVHDLLAFLAERMIEMNRAKNEEIKGFLEWFEREIGAKIETLTNKTKLKQYYDLDFDEVLDILKKNKKKIPVNLSNRELQGNLKEEFEGSMRKLRPLIERIEGADGLINQVVYRLYGLSKAEVRVVEDGRD